MPDVKMLKELSKDEVPAVLRAETYFDFDAHPFAHQALFDRDDVNSVVGAIVAIGNYAKAWLSENIAKAKSEKADDLTVLENETPNNALSCGKFEVILEKGAIFEPATVVGGDEAHTIYVAAGAKVFGSDIYVNGGDLYIGEGTTIEPGVGIKGASIIGKDNEIRQGAYFRGDIVIGDGGTFRGELKNVVMMDKANFPHPGYVGDSLCGFMTHFGNQATAANLGIFEGLRESDQRKNLVLKLEDGTAYDLGRPKLGIIMGDYSQVGCNSVSDPGTFLAPYVIAYALTRLNKGFYGPKEILKNKPMEHGVIERTAFDI